MSEKRLNTAKGYVAGIVSGATWGLDSVLLGVAMAMTPFVENKVLVAGGAILASALHEMFSALWLVAYMARKGRIAELLPALKTRDGRFCALAALFGGPLAMSFYVVAISTGGAALTANVTAIYPLLGTALAVWILKEKTGLQTWVGILLCVAGIFIMGYTPSDGAKIDVPTGIFFALVAAVGWATEAVVCGYGMKDGNVDPMLALLIREVTSSIAYVILVVPIFLKGFGNALSGTMAVFSHAQCLIVIVVTALIGMSSFGCWYTSIDNIGAAKALCLNVTYSFWAVVFTWVLSFVVPQYVVGGVSLHVIVGSGLMLAGVALANLYRCKTCRCEP